MAVQPLKVHQQLRDHRHLGGRQRPSLSEVIHNGGRQNCTDWYISLKPLDHHKIEPLIYIYFLLIN
jgi:hypothetical protein